MAGSVSPIVGRQNLLESLRRAVPLQDRAVGLYRRLLAIHDLGAAMNTAKDIEQIHSHLATYFQEWMPNDSVRLCIVDGANCRRLRLAGPSLRDEEKSFPLKTRAVGSVLRLRSGLSFINRSTLRKNGKTAGGTLSKSIGSVAVFPFSAIGRVVGCLELVANQPKCIENIEYHLARLVAAHLSSSLGNILTRQELAHANARLREKDLKLTHLNAQLQQLVQRDEATGLYNRRRLFEQLDMEIARARRYGEILSCLMLDIDNFKLINDGHGHQAGDETLRQIGSLLMRSLRITDFVARYGGEEFTILLPRTDEAGAYRAAESVRVAMKSHQFLIPSCSIHLTVSIGIASCTKFDRIDAQQIIWRADSALYNAKRSGRDLVCLYDDSKPDPTAVKISSTP